MIRWCLFPTGTFRPWFPRRRCRMMPECGTMPARSLEPGRKGFQHSQETSMNRKITGKALPSIAAVQAEAARVEAMILATQNLESSDGNMRKFMHLQVCRVELQAYLAGLLFTLGHTDLLDTEHFNPEMNASEHRNAKIAGSIVPVCDDDDFRFIECFEC
jgi:hypothetical protein